LLLKINWIWKSNPGNNEKGKWTESLTENKQEIHPEKQKTKTKFPAQKSKPIHQIIELNSADTNELMKLPGIGPVFSNRIVKFRNLVGGFYCTGQLLEVYGMDSARYQKLLNKVSLDTNFIQQININEVTFKELLRHPYFDYEVVKSIFNYKDEKITIVNISELRSIETISDSLFITISPYLIVE